MLILVAVVLVALGASRWYANKQREQLIRAEIEKLGYLTTPEALTRAASTLGNLGADAQDAIPALLEVLLRNERPDSNSSIGPKHTVARALVAIGPASVEPLLEAVRDPRNRERGWGIRPPSQGYITLPALFDALSLMKTKFGAEFDSTAIDETLSELMNNHDCRDVRLWAGRAIGVVQLRRGEVIPYPPSPQWNNERREIAHWTKGLENEEPYARAWAAYILADNSRQLPGQVADWAKALPALAGALEDSDRLAREEGARSLYLLVPHAKGEARDVVPAIIRAIEKSGKKPNPPWSFYQQHLYGCLGAIGSEADGAVPLLLKILQDNESEFRSHAAGALGRIGDADAIPVLINTLNDVDHHLVSASAQAIGRFGPSAKQALPQLLELLDDNRTHSIRVSGEHPEGVPVTVRETVVEALNKIDPETARQAAGL
jgi:HEAT repeat protein